MMAVWRRWWWWRWCTAKKIVCYRASHPECTPDCYGRAACSMRLSEPGGRARPRAAGGMPSLLNRYVPQPICPKVDQTAYRSTKWPKKVPRMLLFRPLKLLCMVLSSLYAPRLVFVLLYFCAKIWKGQKNLKIGDFWCISPPATTTTRLVVAGGEMRQKSPMMRIFLATAAASSSSSSSAVAVPAVETSPPLSSTPTPATSSSSSPTSTLVACLSAYFADSLGNPQRIDYGTGHELHFILFLWVLSEAHLLDRTDPIILQSLVLDVFWSYLDLVRLCQKHYRMEPAGSHGVWGLDDHHHLPFLFGASQLLTHELEISPKCISDKARVDQLRSDYLYFNMIHWIHENKTGPISEHSSVLFSLTTIDQWERIVRGMSKMFEGEVLHKFNIVQHLYFGVYFPFE